MLDQNAYQLSNVAGGGSNSYSNYNRNNERFESQLVVDRALYKESDTVYVKGYLRKQLSDLLTSTPFDASRDLESGQRLQLVTQWTNDYNRVQVVNVSKVHTVFGSFEAEVVVPDDATYGFHTLQLAVVAVDQDGQTNTGGTGGGGEIGQELDGLNNYFKKKRGDVDGDVVAGGYPTTGLPSPVLINRLVGR